MRPFAKKLRRVSSTLVVVALVATGCGSAAKSGTIPKARASSATRWPRTPSPTIPSRAPARSPSATAIHAGLPNGNTITPIACAALSCTLEDDLPPYRTIEMRIRVAVSASAEAGEVNRVAVTGGGAPTASLARPLVISSAPTPFGLEDYELRPEEVGGGPASQAGSHPFQVTGTVVMIVASFLLINASSLPARTFHADGLRPISYASVLPLPAAFFPRRRSPPQGSGRLTAPSRACRFTRAGAAR